MLSDVWLFLLTFSSAVVSIMGVVRGNYWLVAAGGIILWPVCFDLNGTTSFHGLIFLPFFHVASVIALNKHSKRLAWLFLIPSLLLAIMFLTVFIVFGFRQDGVVY
ncbi:MAG: hypothetical protein AB1564_13770 [Chloroflexota bacterium]